MFDVAWKALKTLGETYGLDVIERHGNELVLWHSEYLSLRKKHVAPRLGSWPRYVWRLVKATGSSSYAGVIGSAALQKSYRDPYWKPKPADLVAIIEYRPKTFSGSEAKWRPRVRNSGADEHRRDLERRVAAGEQEALDQLRSEQFLEDPQFLLGAKVEMAGFHLLTKGDNTLWIPKKTTGWVDVVSTGESYQDRKNVTWLFVRLDKPHGRYRNALVFLDEATVTFLHEARWLPD